MTLITVTSNHSGGFTALNTENYGETTTVDLMQIGHASFLDRPGHTLVKTSKTLLSDAQPSRVARSIALERNEVLSSD